MSQQYHNHRDRKTFLKIIFQKKVMWYTFSIFHFPFLSLLFFISKEIYLFFLSWKHSYIVIFNTLCIQHKHITILRVHFIAHLGGFFFQNISIKERKQKSKKHQTLFTSTFYLFITHSRYQNSMTIHLKQSVCSCFTCHWEIGEWEKKNQK